MIIFEKSVFFISQDWIREQENEDRRQATELVDLASPEYGPMDDRLLTVDNLAQS